MKKKLSIIVFLMMILSTLSSYAAMPTSNNGKGDLDQVRDQIQDQICDPGQLCEPDQIRDQIRDNIQDQLCDPDQTCDQIRDQIRDKDGSMSKMGKLNQNEFMNQNGKNIVSLRTLASAFGNNLQWDNQTKATTMSMGQHTFSFRAGENFVVVDGENMAIDTPILLKNGRIYLSEMTITDILGIDVQYANGVANLTMKYDRNLVETAMLSGNFKTLVSAIKVAGLEDMFKSEDSFTLFAPTDAAFANLPDGTVEELIKPENQAKLINILKYHVVSGDLMSTDITKLDKITMLNGSSAMIEIKDGAVMIDGATIIMVDIVATNGVIHVIDAVMLP